MNIYQNIVQPKYDEIMTPSMNYPFPNRMFFQDIVWDLLEEKTYSDIIIKSSAMEDYFFEQFEKSFFRRQKQMPVEVQKITSELLFHYLEPL